MVALEASITNSKKLQEHINFCMHGTLLQHTMATFVPWMHPFTEDGGAEVSSSW